jgi:hypothetical protein
MLFHLFGAAILIPFGNWGQLSSGLRDFSPEQMEFHNNIQEIKNIS